jgi:large subunit ribosomal protein L28
MLPAAGGRVRGTAQRTFALPEGMEHNIGPLPNQAEGSPMSRVCVSCGKQPVVGNSRSHSNVASKRRFNPNLQRVRIVIDGRPQTAYVCARCLRAGRVTKAI